MTSATPLARRLGPVDAVAVGLSAMLGAGVFAAFAPAAAAAGSGLLIGLAIAAVVAFCNATASAQLAARYPVSGGSYIYGRERLGEWWGFAAGWSFVVGKTASCAAMALTFAAYAVPDAWQKPVAVVAVALLVGVNLVGVTRTAAVARVLVVVVLAAVVTVIAVGAASDSATGPGLAALSGSPIGGPYGILQSAGLLFFAFAGYARIATMGEEVRDPARTIPRAIIISLSVALVLYSLVAVTVLTVLGPTELATSTAPLRDVVATASAPWALPVVGIGAAAGALGALLALITGVGRTTLAMARNGDLPRPLAAVGRRQVPVRAELAVGILVVALVLTVDLRTVIGFSSFGVLLYYVVANLSAFTQASTDRRWPRALQVLGTVGCLALVAALPLPSVVGGVLVLAVGLVGRGIARAVTRARDRT